MKIFILLAIFMSCFNAFTAQPGSQGRSSNYYYFELVPKEKLVLTFSSDKICNDDSDKIRVNEFDSKASYPSIDAKGKVAVRIKNIFVESFSICSNNPIGKIEQKVVIGPYNSQMTHIRITASVGVQVSLASDCGKVPPGATFDGNCKITPVTPPKGRK